MKCRSCGADIKNNGDLSAAFEFYYHISEPAKPKSIIIYVVCKHCGTELKQVEKSGEEGLRIFNKMR